MSVTIRQIAATLSRLGSIQMQTDDTRILATLTLRSTRTQTVMMILMPSRFENASILKFQSRVCVAKDARYVKTALKTNGGAERCGLALDTSVTPNVVDVTYGIVADGSEAGHIAAALQHVAEVADRLENATGGGDEF